MMSRICHMVYNEIEQDFDADNSLVRLKRSQRHLFVMQGLFYREETQKGFIMLERTNSDVVIILFTLMVAFANEFSLNGSCDEGLEGFYSSLLQDTLNVYYYEEPISQQRKHLNHPIKTGSKMIQKLKRITKRVPYMCYYDVGIL